MTLEEAKLRTMNKARQGTTCPCCGSYVKVYARRITGKMVANLSGLYYLSKGSKGQYFHTKDILKASQTIQTGDFPKLRFWGLVAKLETSDNVKGSGYYGITDRGMKFLKGNLKVPEKMYIFQNDVLGHSDKMVGISDCKGVKFNFEDIMNGYCK